MTTHSKFQIPNSKFRHAREAVAVSIRPPLRRVVRAESRLVERREPVGLPRVLPLGAGVARRAGSIRHRVAAARSARDWAQVQLPAVRARSLRAARDAAARARPTGV